MTLIDTHCHLNFQQYDADRAAVIARAAAAGVTRVLLPGVDMAHHPSALAMIAEHAGLYAAVGLHPNNADEVDDAGLAHLRAWSALPKVVALGEIGLDYHWNTFPRAQQIAAFEAQLALAADLERPVIIHNRDAHDDTIAILTAWAATLPASLRGRAGVLHSVSAPPAVVERALDCGFYVGFTGPITFKKALETRALAAALPLERILLETDGPYLTPEPYRGKRNEPAYIPYIAAQIAQLRGLSAEEVAATTTHNAAALFGWG
jgi:TatD DNase family protein